MATSAESIRAHAGLPVFSFGFRPFFLFSAAWAAIAVPVWVTSMLGDGMVGGMDGRLWHIHEMLFGYLAGVIAGFLLTAVPNWTGRLPVTGLKLAGLFGLWAAGRAAGFLPASMAIPAAVIDSAFLVVFAAVIWREVVAAKNRRNLPVCLLVSVLAAANIAFHLRGVFPSLGPGAERAAVAVVTGLIALIGGRVTPSFTQNWTRAHGILKGPTAFNRFDAAVLALTAAALAGWVAAPYAPLTGVAMVAAGLANLARLARWRGWLARREALVWILHTGYAWLGVGLVLLGLAALVPEVAPFTAGVHALTAGAMGVETLAIMTRATRGHTGRPRVADGATVAVYLLILCAAVVRVSAPFVTEWTVVLLAVSATLWSLAFAAFVAAYGPMLWRPSL